MLVNIHLYDALARRAAFPIYQRYGINRFELWMLSALVGYLSSKEATIVSKIDFFKFLSGNWNTRKKQEGYFHGLLSKQFIGQYEYVMKPGSQSIGLSSLGVRVMRDYLGSIDEFMKRYTKHNSIAITISEAKPGTKHRLTA